MTAGSIILLDVTQGIDFLEPITRLTPDALFPESECTMPGPTWGKWMAPLGLQTPSPVPPEQLRWPGHCYRSPYPLSEKYFFAAYSFDNLIGEPVWNPPNMFGLYLVDRFGNKELVYRDLNIASLWPVPLRPRPRPPLLSPVEGLAGPRPAALAQPSQAADLLPPTGGRAVVHAPAPAQRSGATESVSPVEHLAGLQEGTFLLQDVSRSWPALPRGSIKLLRIVQVLPKTTPHINEPAVGLPNMSPGKQVLGTVPVEPDGSAYFRAPAGLPLTFQALDEHGQALQIMRSVTYLQPGENAGCIGCHESRTTAPAVGRVALAFDRPPSMIEPGPDGSYPLITLINSEPTTTPGFFGARASGLMQKLLAVRHEGVARKCLICLLFRLLGNTCAHSVRILVMNSMGFCSVVCNVRLRHERASAPPARYGTSAISVIDTHARVLSVVRSLKEHAMTSKVDRRRFLRNAGTSIAAATAATATACASLAQAGQKDKKLKIIGVACSPRQGKTTAAAVKVCLEAAQAVAPERIEVELIDLAGLRIPAQVAVGLPLEPGERDDFPKVADKLGETHVAGIIIGSPVYFCNMSALCKAFLDRCFSFRAKKFGLANKVAGVVAVGGVRNGGQEMTIQSIQAALMCQEMLVVGDGRPTAHTGATLWNSGKDDISEDEFGLSTAKNLGRRVAEVALNRSGT
jgi:multimeric flavodoxin WrbA